MKLYNPIDRTVQIGISGKVYSIAPFRVEEIADEIADKWLKVHSFLSVVHDVTEVVTESLDEVKKELDEVFEESKDVVEEISETVQEVMDVVKKSKKK